MMILKPLQIAIHPRASELKAHNCKGQKLQFNAHGLVNNWTCLKMENQPEKKKNHDCS